mmetsp:Transcript_18012/g.22393  ORF Transcript_18012/g.22393 Transcript_18012/m.22393 type:complete len:228 (-) Transcript_18012:49-732(-)
MQLHQIQPHFFHHLPHKLLILILKHSHNQRPSRRLFQRARLFHQRPHNWSVAIIILPVPHKLVPFRPFPEPSHRIHYTPRRIHIYLPLTLLRKNHSNQTSPRATSHQRVLLISHATNLHQFRPTRVTSPHTTGGGVTTLVIPRIQTQSPNRLPDVARPHQTLTHQYHPHTQLPVPIDVETARHAAQRPHHDSSFPVILLAVVPKPNPAPRQLRARVISRTQIHFKSV